MYKRKLFLVFLFSTTLSFVSCNTKVETDLEDLFSTVSESENENEQEQENESNKEESENKSVAIESTNEIDVLLNEYETTVNQYNEYKERLSDGDITVIREVPTLLDKVKNLKEKLEKVKGEMTTEQLLRMSQIISSI